MYIYACCFATVTVHLEFKIYSATFENCSEIFENMFYFTMQKFEKA